MSEEKCPKCGANLLWHLLCCEQVHQVCSNYYYEFAEGYYHPKPDATCDFATTPVDQAVVLVRLNSLESQLAAVTAERDELNKGLLALAQAWRKQLAPMSDKYKCGYVDGQHRCAVQVEMLLEESEGKR